MTSTTRHTARAGVALILTGASADIRHDLEGFGIKAPSCHFASTVEQGVQDWRANAVTTNRA